MATLIYALLTGVLSSLVWYFIQIHIEENSKKNHIKRLEKERISQVSNNPVKIEGEIQKVTKLYANFFDEFNFHKSIYIKGNVVIIQSTLFTKLSRTIMYVALTPMVSCFFYALTFGDNVWLVFRFIGVIGILTIIVAMSSAILDLWNLKIIIDIDNKVLIQEKINYGEKKVFDLNNFIEVGYNNSLWYPVYLNMGTTNRQISVCAFPPLYHQTGFDMEAFISFIYALILEIKKD